MVIVLLIALLLTACGGGDPAPQSIVAFYGDSITEGRPVDIAQGDFQVQDFAVHSLNSDTPLNPADNSSITVLRYGMADILHNIPPEITRLNIILRVMQISALGRRPVVVNINKTESGMEIPTNKAIADLVTIDVSQVAGATVDGVHPTEPFHVALNQKIHDGLLPYVRH
jgi:hypothetical protein